MSDAKIHFSIGKIEFSAEGESKWVADQLNKILDKSKELVNLSESVSADDERSDSSKTPMGKDSNIAKKALATFLQEKNATTDQTKKFLATAVWLESKGKSRLKTGDVAQSLRDNNQTRLGNASQCLANNVKRGFCEKDGQQFFVTTEGKQSL